MAPVQKIFTGGDAETPFTIKVIRFGYPESLTDQLKGVLSNETLFGTDLYKAGIGERIEEMVRSEISGPGAVRRTLKQYLY